MRGRKERVRAASQTSTLPGEMNLRITNSQTKASMEKKIVTRNIGYFSIFLVWPAGITQILGRRPSSAFIARKIFLTRLEIL